MYSLHFICVQEVVRKLFSSGTTDTHVRGFRVIYLIVVFRIEFFIILIKHMGQLLC